MAVEVLTSVSAQHLPDHSYIPLFGSADLEDWDNMTQDLPGQSQPSYGSGVDSNSSATTHPETHSGGDDMPPPPMDGAASSKKRKPQRPKLYTELRRPASTPHMRGLVRETSPLESPTSEKRRNKLGYHRTSVACGHCRRRKIRCLLAPDDIHGRCLNCIRLKKDCHFYPVDQGPGDTKPRLGGGTDSGNKHKAPSDHSSPRTSAASDSVDDVSKSQGQSSQGPHSIHSSKQSSELDFSESPLDGAPFHSPTFSYAGMPGSSHWGTATFFGNQATLSDDPNTPQSGTEYWPPMQPPGSAIFQHRGSIPGTLDQQAFFVPSNEQAHHWGAMRSMSVGDASLAIQQFQQGIQSHRQAGFSNSPYPYNYTQSSGSSMLATPDQDLNITTTAPVILPSQPLTLNSQAAPQGWNTYGDQSTPIAEQNPGLFSSQWYGEPSSMAPLDESAVITSDGDYIPTTHPG